MLTIAVDTMGSDNGSQPICEAIKSFLKQYKDVKIIAVGKKEELASLIFTIQLINILPSMTKFFFS